MITKIMMMIIRTVSSNREAHAKAQGRATTKEEERQRAHTKHATKKGQRSIRGAKNTKKSSIRETLKNKGLGRVLSEPQRATSCYEQA